MRLLLKRHYTPGNTLGRLFLGDRPICLIREAPNPAYGFMEKCLEEGVYELEPVYEEDTGWRVRVGNEGWILHRPPDQQPRRNEICPVSSFRENGAPMFTQLAFLKLLDQLGVFWERGEILDLQVVSKGIPYAMPSCQIPMYS
ncbi:hypothetical protein DFQ04_1385 [Algoriphagus boseongensis]|uniref:DUF5675 domain-containing protein n=1 Tax=Algoriphagus boseongensis TaxID=1442587 RepID=A0A4R6TBX3_9BACT|nr:hypothetical protein [Algoriphagus boseongensis]TDQ19562.1 hypothetical protein DFQ04_1385 [Algoriphagus boseongensis]